MKQANDGEVAGKVGRRVRRFGQVLTALGFLLVSVPAAAATIRVNHVRCTLADAIRSANDDAAVGGCSAGSGADTIVLPQSSLIVLTEAVPEPYGLNPTGLPPIESEVTIEGNGSTILRDPEAPEFGIFAAQLESAKLTVNETTISGATNLVWGAVVSSFYSEVTLNDCVVTGNTGAGLASYLGDLAVNDSTVAGNGIGISGFAGEVSVTRSAIVLNDGRGVHNAYARVDVVDSTISSNRLAGISADVLHVAGSTFVGNGDVGILVFPSEGDFTIRNSIVSGNGGAGGGEIELHDLGAGLPAPGDHNVFGRQGDAGLYGMVPSDTDIVVSGPLGSILEPELAANGGPTLTHLLRSESPARDAGTACSATDQRGVARPQGPACDVGAVELVPDPCGSASASFGCTVNGVANQRCVGTTGNDTIVGSSGADVIVARAGDDVVWGAAGDDIVCGGDGNDSLQGGSGNDLLSAGPGNDSLSGDHGADILTGGPGANACGTDTNDVSIASCH